MDTFEDSYGCIYLKKGTSIETESRFVVARGGRREVAACGRKVLFRVMKMSGTGPRSWLQHHENVKTIGLRPLHG